MRVLLHSHTSMIDDLFGETKCESMNDDDYELLYYGLFTLSLPNFNSKFWRRYESIIY